MPTTQDYLMDLLAQKKNLVSCVSSCVKCSKDETLNAIIPKLDQYISGEKELFNVLTNNGTNFKNFFKGNEWIKDSIPPLATENGITFSYMFSGCPNLVAFPENYDFTKGKYFDHMFTDSECLVSVPDVSFPNGVVFSYMFNGCTSLRYVGKMKTPKGSNFQYMLANCPNLESIGSIDISKASSNSFTLPAALTSLKEVRFEGKIPGTTFTCRAPNLSDASLDNIYEHLDDLTLKGKTGELLLGKNLSKLNEEQSALISSKGWEAKE